MRYRMLCCLMVTAAAVGVQAGEPASEAGQTGVASLITTWRGHTYQGVMPAEGVVMEFVSYDADAEDLAQRMPMPGRPSGRNGLERAIYSCLAGGGDYRQGAWPKPGTSTNLCWRAPLPAWGASSVVCVGDKAFVTCEAVPATDCRYTLVCVDIPIGILDWVKPIDHLMAMPRDTAEELAAIRRAEVEGWAETMRLWNRIYWDNERDNWFGMEKERNAWKDRLKGGRPGKLSPEREKLLAEANAGGYGMSPDGYHQHTGRYGHAERLADFKTASRSRAYVHCHNKDWPWYGSTCSSPVGDGSAVYAVVSPDAAVCYDLKGNLRWVADMAVGPRPAGFFAGIHRHMASPVIADGKLLYFSNTGMCVFAWDCRTGKLAWKTDLPRVVEPKNARDWWTPKVPRNYNGHMGPGGTPVVMMLKDTATNESVEVVIIANGDVLRAADGKHLGWFDANGDAVYATGTYHGDIYLGKHGTAHRLHLEDGKLVAEKLWNRRDHKSYLSLAAIDRGFITTDGLWDPATGRTLADAGDLWEGRHGYVAGSISRDGIYVKRWSEIGNSTILFSINDLNSNRRGLGIIVEGKQPDAVRQAAIDRFGMSRIHLGWAHPTMHGNRIFVRTNTHLYCFGKGEWKSAGEVMAADPEQEQRTRR